MINSQQLKKSFSIIQLTIREQYQRVQAERDQTVYLTSITVVYDMFVRYKTKLFSNSPEAQVDPVKPATHLQMNAVADCFVHDPPLRQGALSHGLMAERYCHTEQHVIHTKAM
jgi:hypothetical protein